MLAVALGIGMGISSGIAAASEDASADGGPPSARAAGKADSRRGAGARSSLRSSQPGQPDVVAGRRTRATNPSEDAVSPAAVANPTYDQVSGIAVESGGVSDLEAPTEDVLTELDPGAGETVDPSVAAPVADVPLAVPSSPEPEVTAPSPMAVIDDSTPAPTQEPTGAWRSGILPTTPLETSLSFGLLAWSRKDFESAMSSLRAAFPAAATPQSTSLTVPLTSSAVAFVSTDASTAAANSVASPAASLTPGFSGGAAQVKASATALDGLFGAIQSLITGFINAVQGIFRTLAQLFGIPAAKVNHAPTADATAGGPDGISGAVIVTITGTDADGDTLTYQVTTPPAKGNVTAAGSGVFTYTPTQDARYAAAAPNAPTADTRDSFTVTVSDGQGGSAPIAVTVPISPTSNKAPAITGYSASEPGSGGVVSGTVTATDPDADSLSFSGPSTSTGGGSVEVEPGGAFTYTPTADQRHFAAADHAPTSALQDSFAVTVADGRGGTDHATITVAINSYNDNPSGGAATGLATDPQTGTVTGTITGVTDPDSDSLSFSTPATSSSGGAVSVDTYTGAFTYIPTEATRAAAASPQATPADQSDTFTVTAVDGHGGAAAILVTVPVSPTPEPPNQAPTITGYHSTDASSTGVVTGSVAAADPDGDALTFSGSTTTTKGAVSVSATGDFTYTPTATARHGAAATNATAFDQTDTFTVTVTDGHGGTAIVAVGVMISPQNSAPVVSISSVGSPDSVTAAVKITLTASDLDGDILTYSLPTPPLNGSVIFESDNELTYTPTADARDTAADPNATESDRTDTFTLSLADDFGGATQLLIAVPIEPADQPVVLVSMGTYSSIQMVTEGDSGSVTAYAPVVLSQAASAPVTVSYRVDTPYGFNATPDVDFAAETNTVVFAPGQTTTRIPVTVYGDTQWEDDEFARVTLTGVTGAEMNPYGMTTATITIINDDLATTAQL